MEGLQAKNQSLEKTNQSNPRIALIRHFDDIDDLSIPNRDGELLPEQEYKAFLLAKDIVEECKESETSAVFFIVSPKKRTQETARLISDEIKKINPFLKIRVSVEGNLRAMDEGTPILPKDYQAGDSFEGFKIAGKVFSAEAHKSDQGQFNDNIDYKYGSSMVDNEEKYPELSSLFSSPGESYRDVVSRIFTLVVKFKELQQRSSEKIKFVIVTHGQPSQIIKDLVSVFSKIESGAITYTEGALLKLCWQAYKERDVNEKVTGRIDFVMTDLLFKEELFTMFSKELNLLYGKNK